MSESIPWPVSGQPCFLFCFRSGAISGLGLKNHCAVTSMAPRSSPGSRFPVFCFRSNLLRVAGRRWRVAHWSARGAVKTRGQIFYKAKISRLVPWYRSQGLSMSSAHVRQLAKGSICVCLRRSHWLTPQQQPCSTCVIVRVIFSFLFLLQNERSQQARSVEVRAFFFGEER